jgi:hypothetical protein
MVLKPIKGKIKNNNIATIIKELGIILKYNSTKIKTHKIPEKEAIFSLDDRFGFLKSVYNLKEIAI